MHRRRIAQGLRFEVPILSDLGFSLKVRLNWVKKMRILSQTLPARFCIVLHGHSFLNTFVYRSNT